MLLEIFEIPFLFASYSVWSVGEEGLRILPYWGVRAIYGEVHLMSERRWMGEKKGAEQSVREEDISGKENSEGWTTVTRRNKARGQSDIKKQKLERGWMLLFQK